MDIEKIHSLISHAADKEPVSFADILSDILGQKAAELVSAEREEVANKLFNPDDEVEGEDDDTEVVDSDDTDGEDEETQ